MYIILICYESESLGVTLPKILHNCAILRATLIESGKLYINSANGSKTVFTATLQCDLAALWIPNYSTIKTAILYAIAALYTGARSSS